MPTNHSSRPGIALYCLQGSVAGRLTSSVGRNESMAIMQWSKLKRNVEAFFADSVKGRVGLHTTRYRTMHDHDGQAWITLDGDEIINMVHIWKWLWEVERKAASLAGETDLRNRKDCSPVREAAEKELKDESIFTQSHLGRAMHDYQSMSMEDILASENPVIRAIGMLDRRLGVRRLRKIDTDHEHPLVRVTYVFRCRAEGLTAKREAPNNSIQRTGDQL